MQAPIKSQWLLALCAVLDAIISVLFLIIYDTGPGGGLTVLRLNGMAGLLSRLALAAGGLHHRSRHLEARKGQILASGPEWHCS